MIVICFAPYMYTLMKIRVCKGIIEWKQGFGVITFLDLNTIPIPLQIFLLMNMGCADNFSLLSMLTLRNFVSFTSCILAL